MCIDSANVRCYSGSGSAIQSLANTSLFSSLSLENGATLANTSARKEGFVFDGTNEALKVWGYTNNTDWANTGYGYTYPTGNFTLACWVKTTESFSGFKNIFGKAVNVIFGGFPISSNTIRCGLYLNGNDGRLSIRRRISNSSEKILYSSSILNDGNWHYCAATFGSSSGGNIKLYFDGSLESSTTMNGTMPNSSSNFGVNPLGILSCSSSLAALYGRELTAEEIKLNYDASKKRYK